jgi:hypothetical protein
MVRNSKAQSKPSSSTTGSSNNVAEQLSMLRNFVEPGKYTEAQLTDCLRQCGYNPNTAAERLMMGEYKPDNKNKTKGTKSAFFKIQSSSTLTTPAQQTKTIPRVSVSSSDKKKATAASKKRAPVTKATSKRVAPSSSLPKAPPQEQWLLCERWISDATCITKNGKMTHKEALELTHAQTGFPCVRFRGTSIEGRLPDNLSMMLCPILREQGNLVSLQAEALMEESNIPVGAQIPIALRVFVDPRVFFDMIFQQESMTTTTNSYFDNKQAKKSKKKKHLPLAEAAFGLLQWAEYGDVPDFQPPQESQEDKTIIIDEEDDEDDDDDEAEMMKEEDFEAASVSSVRGTELDKSVSTVNDWMMKLPEAEDPKGFLNGITLRPYQRQALYWMNKREQDGESREDLEKQLTLLSDMACSDQQRKATPTVQGKDEIVCDCGPVRVTEQARKRSKTVEGETNPVQHPLWKQRFLASQSMDKTLSFYVNELLGVATHRVPPPPSPCSGGVRKNRVVPHAAFIIAESLTPLLLLLQILADSMGLGKTVICMALILKAKEDRAETSGPKSTLVVAKLSLLPQWEEELKTKTTLTYRVYYGQGKISAADLDVDVVITTYGTIQGESKRKNPVLLNCQWMRLILDEAHCVRNQNTLASRVCCELQSLHRWAVTGTVIQNSLDDVFGMMKVCMRSEKQREATIGHGYCRLTHTVFY